MVHDPDISQDAKLAKLTKLRNLLLDLVRALVDDEGAVQLHKELIGTHNVVWEIVVRDKDMGLVIGQKGAHMDAIRLLLIAATKKLQMKYYFEVMSDINSR